MHFKNQYYDNIMIEATHKKIADIISANLKLIDSERGLLRNGSVLPDYQHDFPHHTGKSQTIKTEIENARKLFLEKDDECYMRLGIALHYIQDGWTSKPRTGDKHTAWEQLIQEQSERFWTGNARLCTKAWFKSVENEVNNATIPSKTKVAYWKFMQVILFGPACVIGIKTSRDYKEIEIPLFACGDRSTYDQRSEELKRSGYETPITFEKIKLYSTLFRSRKIAINPDYPTPLLDYLLAFISSWLVSYYIRYKEEADILPPHSEPPEF